MSAETGDTLTWKQLLRSAEHIVILKVPANAIANETAAIPCAVSRCLIREANADVRAGSSAKRADDGINAQTFAGRSASLVFEIDCPAGEYLAFLSEKNETAAGAWRVRRQTLYSSEYAPFVLASLIAPEKIGASRYLSTEDRQDAVNAPDPSNEQPRLIEQPKNEPAPSAPRLALSVAFIRDAYDQAGFGIARFTLSATSDHSEPVAVYIGPSAIWALSITGGAIDEPIRIQPGFDPVFSASRFDPESIATPEDFTIIRPGQPYVHDAFLSPNEFPDLEKIKTRSTAIAGFRSPVGRLSELTERDSLNPFPVIWAGQIASQPVIVDLHIDLRERFLKRLEAGDPDAVRDYRRQRFELPDNVPEEQITPPELKQDLTK
jgi:hypothetical protein